MPVSASTKNYDGLASKKGAEELHCDVVCTEKQSKSATRSPEVCGPLSPASVLAPWTVMAAFQCGSFQPCCVCVFLTTVPLGGSQCHIATQDPV